MKIEEGKFYRTRDGRKAGPMKCWGAGWVDASRTRGDMWQDDGLRYYSENRGDDDIIAEWTDGAVREVTRKEIVFGVFGRVMVNEDPKGGFLNSVAMSPTKDPVELRAAASTLTAIADALEETK